MRKFTLHIFLLIFLFCSVQFGKTAKENKNSNLTKVYTLAIAEFIKAANERNKTKFDTLYFWKRASGQEDDFPDIALPQEIENTQIRLISPKLGEAKQKESNSNIYINLVGWVDAKRAEFMFVVFSNGFEHKYDYSIRYKYNSKQKKWELVKIEFLGGI